VASKSRRLEPNERSQRIAEAAQILGLTEYLDRKPGELSGGQRQRVALARAIVRRPDVFLMDEPLSNLDAKLRTQTRAELVDLHRRLSTTFVYVTHDQVEAMTMATRVAIIADGKLHQAGTPEEVYARPANLFVATFIGSPPMNVLNGVLHETDGVRSVVTEAGTIAISGSAPAESSEPGSPSGGRGVAAAVRPEHLSVDPSGTLDATVASVEHLGHEVHVLVKIGSEMVVIRQSTSAPRVAPGSSTRVRVDPQEVHLFDPSSGERVS
jgi:ABC-type sugar transport system ATPase subunit